MNVRWIIPTVLVVVSLTSGAFAQTAATSTPTLRPAIAASGAPVAVTQPSAGVATTVAPVAQPASRTSDFAESFDQAPPAPPSPPSPPSPAAAPQAPQATRGSRGDMPAPVFAPRRGQLVNLRLEFTVTDQIGTAPPVKKTITMNVADGESGRIRTNADVFRKNSSPTVVPLAVDASPEIESGKIRLRASLEYQLLSDAAGPDLPAGKTSITQSVTSILNDGVLTILSQSADPLTDRKVTLEVKATIIK